MQNSVDHIECSWNLSSSKCVHRVFNSIEFSSKVWTKRDDTEIEQKQKKTQKVADQIPTNICVMIFNFTFILLFHQIFVDIFVGIFPCRRFNWFLYAVICFHHLLFAWISKKKMCSTFENSVKYLHKKNCYFFVCILKTLALVIVPLRRNAFKQKVWMLKIKQHIPTWNSPLSSVSHRK